MENNLNRDIRNILEKNIIIEKDVIDLKIENENLKDRLKAMEKELENIKDYVDVRLSNKEENVDIKVVVEEDLETGATHNCEKCDFIGKTEAGLKTHVTTKHKTASLRGYRKIT